MFVDFCSQRGDSLALNLVADAHVVTTLERLPGDTQVAFQIGKLTLRLLNLPGRLFGLGLDLHG